MEDIPALAQASRGTTSNGVPFVALPPEEGREATSVVILWHGADPPRTEEALAAAVPLRGLPAWRIYLLFARYCTVANGSLKLKLGILRVMRRCWVSSRTL